METVHTRGPWYVQGNNPPRIYARAGMDIIAQCDSAKEMTRAEEMANARLIATAPELLAACKRILAAIEWEYTGGRMEKDEQAAMLRAVINKAAA